eukprot:8727641-Pyramimonas_sp.AAC.1
MLVLVRIPPGASADPARVPETTSTTANSPSRLKMASKMVTLAQDDLRPPSRQRRSKMASKTAR